MGENNTALVKTAYKAKVNTPLIEMREMRVVIPLRTNRKGHDSV